MTNKVTINLDKNEVDVCIKIANDIDIAMKCADGNEITFEDEKQKDILRTLLLRIRDLLGE